MALGGGVVSEFSFRFRTCFITKSYLQYHKINNKQCSRGMVVPLLLRRRGRERERERGGERHRRDERGDERGSDGGVNHVCRSGAIPTPF